MRDTLDAHVEEEMAEARREAGALFYALAACALVLVAVAGAAGFLIAEVLR